MMATFQNARCWIAVALFACILATSAAADEPTLTARIDQRLTEIWQRQGVEPAPRCDRSAFLRRATLDLMGRIPTVAEARQFAANDSPSERLQVVNKFLDHAAFAQHWSRSLREIWFPQTSVDPYRYLADDTERWLAVQLQLRRPVHAIAHDLIAVSAEAALSDRRPSDPSSPQIAIPRTLIEANDLRAEQMASNATAAFLGVDLSCAQCHDHPLGNWTQDQFWQTAAFFESTGNKTSDELSILIPDTDRRVRAVLFTGDRLPSNASKHGAGRTQFADWMTDPTNPFFARHTVNQIWAKLFGRPLVPSLTDRTQSDPNLAALLDDVAADFAASGFDLRLLVRALTMTKAYQASSQIAAGRPAQSKLAVRTFALASVRGLSGEQLYDSLLTAAGRLLVREDLDEPSRIAERKRFCERFRIASTSKPQRSIVQALALMNGDLTNSLVSPEENALVATVADAPFMNESSRIETLFLATLGRLPTPDEQQRLQAAGLMRKGQKDRSPAERADRYARLFWLFINTVEFNTNH